MLDKFLELEDRARRYITEDGPVKAIISVLLIYAYVGFILYAFIIMVYKTVFGG